jgi:hypothetical protein
VGGLRGRKKKGQPLSRPVYEWNEAFEKDIYLDFP